MSMMAVFACSNCGTQVIHGFYSGKDGRSEICCLKCAAKTMHGFAYYKWVDERSDAQRMRDRLKEGA